VVGNIESAAMSKQCCDSMMRRMGSVASRLNLEMFASSLVRTDVVRRSCYRKDVLLSFAAISMRVLAKSILL